MAILSTKRSPDPAGRGVSQLLARLARSLSLHWKRGLAAAVGVLVLLVLAAAAADKAVDDFSLPGAESQQAVDLFQAHSPAFGGVDSMLVFTVDEGKVSDAAPRAAIEGALAKVRALEGVGLAASPFGPGGQVSEDGRLAAVDVRYSSDPATIVKADGEALIAAGETAEPEVQVEARGVLIDLASEQAVPVGELIGVAVAIVLLLLLFRSSAAMAATLIGALFGVAAGQVLLAAVSAPLGLPTFAAFLAVMIGLGAGIDYSLLIIGRYREQRAAGDGMQDAAARAAATSGTTVVAAGLIVMVAIAGLLVVGVPPVHPREGRVRHGLIEEGAQRLPTLAGGEVVDEQVVGSIGEVGSHDGFVADVFRPPSVGVDVQESALVLPPRRPLPRPPRPAPAAAPPPSALPDLETVRASVQAELVLAPR